jgi:hypothetical protein
MGSRASRQFNELHNGIKNGTSTWSVPQYMRNWYKEDLSTTMQNGKQTIEYTPQESLKKAKLNFINYTSFKLPDQGKFPEINEEMKKAWYQYILYSQTEQNRSDKLSHDMSLNYLEDRYIVEQENGNFEFNGTYWIEKDRATLSGWLSIQDYMKKFPDAVFLGVGKFKQTAEVE